MTSGEVAARFTVLDATGREIPWGNGIGSSREIAGRYANGDGSGPLCWRLSTTRIRQTCDFSDYKGYDRTITLLEGGLFELNFGDQAASIVAERHRPHRFSGGWPTFCRLLGDTASVLNVMVADGIDYSVTPVRFTATPTSLQPNSRITLLYCLSGRLSIVAPPGDRYALMTGETFMAAMEGNTALPVLAQEAAADALVIGIDAAA